MTLRTKSTSTNEAGTSNSIEMDLVGIKQIADYLGFCQRTVWSWRREFSDFPVKQDGASCVWYSSRTALDSFREKHADLFTYHKERLDRYYANDERRQSKW